MQQTGTEEDLYKKKKKKITKISHLYYKVHVKLIEKDDKLLNLKIIHSDYLSSYVHLLLFI